MMATHTVYKLHNERVLWPEHKPLDKILELQRTTPDYIWETTYQGNPVDPSGSVFKREWWDGKNRYNPVDLPIPIARYISIDTATSEEESSAYTAYCVFDLLPDYKLALVEVGRKRVEFPELVSWITSIYSRYQRSQLLRNIVIEDASSGKQLLQTLRKAGGDLADVLTAFQPRVEKYARWGMAAVWCRNDCILFPAPSAQFPWLLDFEEELFNVPGAANLDQADSFSQGIIFLENILSEGYAGRSHV